MKIESAEENDFIKREYLTGVVDYWIGLTDSVNEGEWKWSDGTRLTGCINWFPTQPNNINDQDCGGIRYEDRKGSFYDAQWHDNGCSNVKGCICEK